ncbi:MAG: hypothetical protein ACOC8D_02330 [bacterium]
MSRSRIAALVGGLVVTGLAFFFLGRWTQGGVDLSRQHVNNSSDLKEFRNRFLDLRVRAPEGAEWELVYKPSRLRPTPQGANKVLEINRLLPRRGSREPWARMDLYVEHHSGLSADEVIEKFEFRPWRDGYDRVSDETTQVDGHPARVCTGAWSVKGTRYRNIVYAVEYGGRWYVFTAVCERRAFPDYRPIFDQILAGVRLG